MTHAELARLAPGLPAEAREIILDAIRAGEARIRLQGGFAVYDDPMFGKPVPLDRLGYDPELGLTAE